MTGEELYFEGQERLSRQLGNAQYSGAHSQDIMRDVYANYTLPAAELGYPPAIKDVVDHCMARKDYIVTVKWLKKYKGFTGFSNMKMLTIFGPSIMKLAF